MFKFCKLYKHAAGSLKWSRWGIFYAKFRVKFHARFLDQEGLNGFSEQNFSTIIGLMHVLKFKRKDCFFFFWESLIRITLYKMIKFLKNFELFWKVFIVLIVGNHTQIVEMAQNGNLRRRIVWCFIPLLLN